MTMLLALAGLNLAALPMLLFYLLIVVIFLALLYFILSKLPAPINQYAWWAVIVIAGIILLYVLIGFAQGGGLNL